MTKGKCIICKIIGILAIIGALNWGSIGIGTGNFVEGILGDGGITKIFYILVGLSGVAMLIMCFKPCPCKKE